MSKKTKEHSDQISRIFDRLCKVEDKMDKGLTMEKLLRCADELEKVDKTNKVIIDGVGYYKVEDIIDWW